MSFKKKRALFRRTDPIQVIWFECTARVIKIMTRKRRMPLDYKPLLARLRGNTFPQYWLTNQRQKGQEL